MDAKTIRRAYAKRDSDYYGWRKVAEAAGINATLDALGYSRDRQARWYNVHAGSVETLNELISYSCVGRNDTPESQLREFAMVLENWLPQDGDTNPVLAAANAVTEEAAKLEVQTFFRSTLGTTSSADEFVDRVHDQGGTTEHGFITTSPKGPANVRLTLHDDREFKFSLRALWRDFKATATQPTLFA